MTFLANHKDLFIWFLQYFRAQGFFEILPFADVSQTLVFLMASHSISIYLFATCFTLQYCANREDVLIFFLFYDPEFLHSRQRFHLSFFPLHKERKNCWNSQIKSVDIREREKERRFYTLGRLSPYFVLPTKLLSYYHQNDTAPPLLVLHCALL